MTLPEASFASLSPTVRDDGSRDAAERAWVDRIRAGDLDAFEALYRAYWQPLYTFAFRYVRSKHDAEDVAQEVFFRIWRGRSEWLPAGAVRNYLFLAVRNAARDRLERAAVARRWSGRVASLAVARTDPRSPITIPAPTLVVLAAGLGTRYGGLKQLAPVGPSREALLDYGVYDAVRAGFRKVVLVIREEVGEFFRRHVADVIGGGV